MALAKKRTPTLLVAKLDRLSCSVAFIATLMDSFESIRPRARTAYFECSRNARAQRPPTMMCGWRAFGN